MSHIQPNLSSNYLTNVGVADKSRAASLNLIFDPYSLHFFPFDKLSDNDKILFAGCGNGQLVVEIAKEIKMRGLKVNIVAFDISEEQLTCARQYAEQENEHNIDWRLQDAHDLKDLKGQFNVVHARFLLNHLPDAPEVTELLCSTLTDGGIFIGEEFASDEVEVSPNLPEYTDAIGEWLKEVRLLHILQKSDMAFAKHLPEILKNNNMLVSRELQPKPSASDEKQKNVFPECMAYAHKVFPADLHHTIPIIIAALEKVRDSKECSITFNYFTQIEARKISQ
jgi:ubiquinone/menaquinone biosynthesis C-methylase UbiE